MPDLSESGIVLVSSLPAKALGGIDLLSFNPGSNFRGIKQLPPGFHFIFTGSTDSFSIRHGMWFKIRQPSLAEPQILIAKWEESDEKLVPEKNEAEQIRLRANVDSSYASLLVYRQNAPKEGTDTSSTFDDGWDWTEMTSHLSEALLSRIMGPVGEEDWGWSLTTGSSAKQDEDDIPGLSAEEAHGDSEKDLQFLPINLKQTWRSGATGRERTEAARDRSQALNDLIEQHCFEKNHMEVLGELELCFLMVLTLANYSCLEQWKRILGLLCTCQKAVEDIPELFVETIRTLKTQLKHSEDVDGGLFDMSEDGGALLKGLVRKFRKGLDNVSGLGKSEVLDELDELEDFLRSEYGWEIGESFLKRGMLQLEDGEQVEMEVSGYEEDDESGEYAPQIVDLTPAQRHALSIPEVEPSKSTTADEEDEEDDRDLEDMDDRY